MNKPFTAQQSIADSARTMSGQAKALVEYLTGETSPTLQVEMATYA